MFSLDSLWSGSSTTYHGVKIDKGSDSSQQVTGDGHKFWREHRKAVLATGVIDKDETFSRDFVFNSLSASIAVIDPMTDPNGWLAFKDTKHNISMDTYRTAAYNEVFRVINDKEARNMTEVLAAVISKVESMVA